MNIEEQIDNLIHLAKNDKKMPIEFFTTIFNLAKQHDCLYTISKEQVFDIEKLYVEKTQKQKIISFFPGYYSENKTQLLETMSKLPYESKFIIFNDILDIKDQFSIEDINFLFKETVLKNTTQNYYYKSQRPMEEERLALLTEHFISKEIFFDHNFQYGKSIESNFDAMYILCEKLATENNNDINNETYFHMIEKIVLFNLYLETDPSKGKIMLDNFIKSFPEKNTEEMYFDKAMTLAYQSTKSITQSKMNSFIKTLSNNYKEKNTLGIPNLWSLTLLTNRFISKVSDKNLSNLFTLKAESTSTILPYLIFSKADVNEKSHVNTIYQNNPESSLMNDMNLFLNNPIYINVINDIEKPIFLIKNLDIEPDFIRQNLSDKQAASLLTEIKEKNLDIATSIFMSLNDDIDFLPNNHITDFLCTYLTKIKYINRIEKEKLFEKYNKHIVLSVIDTYLDERSTAPILNELKLDKISKDKLALDNIFNNETKLVNNKKRL